MQLFLVKTIVLPGTRVFVLTPLLLFLGLFTGIITAWLLLLAEARFKIIKTDSNE